MNKPEYQEDYKKRGYTAEPPNGTLKEQFHINQIISRGQQDKENKVTLKAVVYNLRVIFNKILEADETIDFKNIVKYHIDDYMLEISEEFDDIKFKLIELKKSKSITEEWKNWIYANTQSFVKKEVYLCQEVFKKMGW